VEVKPEMDLLTRRAASDSSTPTWSFSCIRPDGHFSILVGPINSTQGGWD
jgi:hypothetical protein